MSIRVFIPLLAAATFLGAQEPTVRPGPTNKPGGANADAAAIAGAKEDPASVERGGKVYAKNCAGCHGAAAKGGPGAPSLVRSLLVLDDEKGLLIGPVIREGRPDKGMPKIPISEPEIADVVAWLHVRTYSAGHRNTYEFGNIVTGDPAKGKAYFEGAGKCSTCHSATNDLAGIGKKYDPFALQGRWLQPRAPRRGPRAASAQASSKSQPTVTVTPANGQSVSGTLDRIDDFTVSLHDERGQFHSFARSGDTKVEVKDPLQAHTDLLGQYTDADIHNITAYLVTLK